MQFTLQQQLAEVLQQTKCFRTADIITIPSHPIDPKFLEQKNIGPINTCTTVGEVMSYCHDLVAAGAPMTNVNNYCIDHYNISYGYLLTMESVAIGFSSLTGSDYSFYYTNCVTSL